MKKVFTLLVFVLFALTMFGQEVFHARVDKTDLSLRGTPVVLAQVTVTATVAGKVMVRFDGDCISTPGDRIVLAASRVPNWGGSANSVYVKAMSTDLNSNVFSHTRVYDVAPGVHTFYAVAENYAETTGSGKASIYGSLTAELFTEVPGKAFVRHQNIAESNFNVEGAPVILAEQSIDVTTPGKVVVRFDGLCISNDGDLIMLAASNTPGWSSYDGSSSIEIPNDDFNKNCFAHVRTYDVTPGDYKYYAVIENYYEIYGNGIASVLGSLTVTFYPNNAPVEVTHTYITQFGTVVDVAPVSLGEVAIDAPVAGKVILNFTGTCIGSFGDYIKLAASDTPNWSANDGNIGFEPFSSDRNRTSFSHTRAYDVAPGVHPFYAVVQNVQEFFGSGLVVVYGALNATFYPSETVAATTPELLRDLVATPNPVTDVLTVSAAAFASEAFDFRVVDMRGSVLQQWHHAANTGSDRIAIPVAHLPSGVYMLQVAHRNNVLTQTFVIP
jgi:hypothetical protein